MSATKPSHVLVIEDDPDQVLMYQVEFEAHDFRVSTATTGDEGLAKAKQEKPDAILLDVLMEGKSGLEVLEELKKDPTTKVIPVVVFTNYGKEEFAARAKELGAEMFLMKTSRVPRELVADVLKLIGRTPKPMSVRPHRAENILLIEDNPFHRQMYATKFERAGFLLTTTLTGEEGLKKAREGDTDLILLDLALPTISGLDVLKALKEDPSTKDIPVVVLTAMPKNQLPAEARQLIETHAVGYSEKFTQLPSEVVELVEKILGKPPTPPK